MAVRVTLETNRYIILGLPKGLFIFYQGGGINIYHAQGGARQKKSSQERGAMYPTSLTMGGPFLHQQRGRQIFCKGYQGKCTSPSSLVKNEWSLISWIFYHRQHWSAAYIITSIFIIDYEYKCNHGYMFLVPKILNPLFGTHPSKTAGQIQVYSCSRIQKE